jgi:hypothetical protein
MTAIKHALLLLAALATLSSALAAQAEESSSFVERNQTLSARALKH